MCSKQLLLFPLLIFSFSTFAQEKWGLQKCVDYAMEHNISIRQSELQSDISAINYKQSRLSQIPSANFSNSEGFRFGKSQNPSTGILENQNYFSVGLNFQSSVEIFNFFSKKNTILANEWTLEASKAQTEKLKDDIALLVANNYLQVLLSIEQQKIAEVQVKQSMTQLDIVKKQVNAGAVPELNALELESQLSNDSANLITAIGNVSQAKLVLKSNMFLDAAAPFEIDEPPVDQIPLEAAKGALYPSVSAFGSFATNYGYFRSPIFSKVLSGYAPSGLVVPDGSGGFISVQQPVFTNGTKTGYVTAPGLGDQFNNNFGQQLGLSISVPIFNGWQAKANYQRSKINIRNIEYQKDLDNENLKQNIYQAYNAVIVAVEKFTSSLKAVETAQRSYDVATKRYTVGMLTTLELVTNQNNLFRAKLQYVVNQFDYVFKMKVLEFYKGEGLKLQ